LGDFRRGYLKKFAWSIAKERAQELLIPSASPDLLSSSQITFLVGPWQDERNKTKGIKPRG
jgi:hypothetical protein